MGNRPIANLTKIARRRLLEILPDIPSGDLPDILDELDNYAEACKIEALQEKEAEIQRMTHMIFSATMEAAKKQAELACVVPIQPYACSCSVDPKPACDEEE